MQKEFEKQEKLKNLDEEHKKQMLKELEDNEKKHKQHEPVSSYVQLHKCVVLGTVFPTPFFLFISLQKLLLV
jgi:hypothetical protein